MKTNKLTACLAALALTLGTAALTYAAAPGYNAPVQAFDDDEIAGWTE